MITTRLPAWFTPLFGGILLAAGFTTLMFFRFVTSLPEPPGTGNIRPIVESADPLVSKVESAPTLTAPLERPTDFTLGDERAPVTIVEFSDFACPYCRTMAAQLRAAVARHPEVRLVWKDFPVTTIHPEATSAHIAARCAGEQGKFWEYHDRLFERQGQLSRSTYLAIAQQLSLRPTAFAACLDSAAPRAAIEINIAEGNSLGLDATPYLFVGDQRLSGLLTSEELEQVIDFHRSLQEQRTP